MCYLCALFINVVAGRLEKGSDHSAEHEQEDVSVLLLVRSFHVFSFPALASVV